MRVNLESAKRTDLPAAFNLVRTVLQGKSITFQELLKSGIEIERDSSNSPPSSSEIKSMPQSKGKKEIRHVPEGHTWVSSSFLKTRVLPILASQQLIEKKAHHTPSDKTTVWKWQLSPSSLLWDQDKQWSRLVDLAEHPASVWSDLQAHQTRQAIQRKDRAFETGRKTRTEKEIWEWNERPLDLTTPLQRMHLSKRRRNNRDKKERQLSGLRIKVANIRNARLEQEKLGAATI